MNDRDLSWTGRDFSARSNRISAERAGRQLLGVRIVRVLSHNSGRPASCNDAMPNTQSGGNRARLPRTPEIVEPRQLSSSEMSPVIAQDRPLANRQHKAGLAGLPAAA